MEQKSFPEKLYITRENEGEEEEFFNPHETVDETAEIGKEVSVAVYELVSISTVRTNVEVSDKTA